MIPTYEQFEKIKTLMFSQNENIENLQPEDFFVFDINICNTNIDENYKCYSRTAIYQLAEDFRNMVTKISNESRIFDSYITRKSGDILYLFVSLVIIRKKENEKIIKRIEKSKELEIKYLIHIRKYKCSKCKEKTIGGKQDCSIHKKGEIYNNKIAHILITDLLLINWTMKI